MDSQIQLFASPQQAKTSDEYYTPAWVFEALGVHFELDVASPPHKTFVPCDRYLTIEDDGLAQPWHGRVWMNPPFSNCKPWVEKWLCHANGIALLPMAKGCAWLDQLWNGDARLVMTKRISFHHKGRRTEIAFPTALWAIGDDNIAALHNIGQVR